MPPYSFNRIIPPYHTSEISLSLLSLTRLIDFLEEAYQTLPPSHPSISEFSEGFDVYVRVLCRQRLMFTEYDIFYLSDFLWRCHEVRRNHREAFYMLDSWFFEWISFCCYFYSFYEHLLFSFSYFPPVINSSDFFPLSLNLGYYSKKIFLS